jgi:biopolymer transport protein ExbD
MSHKRKKTRVRGTKRKIEEVPMTPMIDVVFQMLIYFVFTFEIPDRISEMKVWRPQGETSAPTTDVISDNITVYRPASPNASPYALNDRGTTLETLTAHFKELADNDPTQSIIVKATYNSQHKDLVALLNVLTSTGLQNISLFSAE